MPCSVSRIGVPCAHFAASAGSTANPLATQCATCARTGGGRGAPGEPVLPGGGGVRGAPPPVLPCLHEYADRFLAAQRHAEVLGLGVVEHLAQHVAETQLGPLG